MAINCHPTHIVIMLNIDSTQWITASQKENELPRIQFKIDRSSLSLTRVNPKLPMSELAPSNSIAHLAIAWLVVNCKSLNHSLTSQSIPMKRPCLDDLLLISHKRWRGLHSPSKITLYGFVTRLVWLQISSPCDDL